MRRDFGRAKRNPRGYEQAFPSKARREVSLSQFELNRQLMENPPFEVKPAPRIFLGYDDPMKDPRVQGYVVVEHGVTVRTVGHPC